MKIEKKHFLGKSHIEGKRHFTNLLSHNDSARLLWKLLGLPLYKMIKLFQQGRIAVTSQHIGLKVKFSKCRLNSSHKSNHISGGQHGRRAMEIKYTRTCTIPIVGCDNLPSRGESFNHRLRKRNRRQIIHEYSLRNWLKKDAKQAKTDQTQATTLSVVCFKIKSH